MTSADRIRILLVEDHAIVRDGVRGFLQTYPNIEVVGEAADGAEALGQVETLRPAVVLMDIIMPKMDGIAATRFIKARYPHTVVLGLAQNPPAYNVHALVRAGAFEVVSKERIFEDLYGAIQKAVASTSNPPAASMDDLQGSA